MISMTSLTAAYLRIADDPPVDVDPSTGKGPEWGKASPVGLLIILLLAIATFFLLRSMTRRLKRVQNQIDAAAAPAVTTQQTAAQQLATAPASAPTTMTTAESAATTEPAERSDSPSG